MSADHEEDLSFAAAAGLAVVLADELPPIPSKFPSTGEVENLSQGVDMNFKTAIRRQRLRTTGGDLVIAAMRVNDRAGRSLDLAVIDGGGLDGYYLGGSVDGLPSTDFSLQLQDKAGNLFQLGNTPQWEEEGINGVKTHTMMLESTVWHPVNGQGELRGFKPNLSQFEGYRVALISTNIQ